MKYRIEFSPTAEFQFKKLPKEVQVRLKHRINILAENPFPRGVKKLSAQENFYRLRIGDYRIIYQVQGKALLMLIFLTGSRMRMKIKS
jgi:mRNA interferase RelE/StbE